MAFMALGAPIPRCKLGFVPPTHPPANVRKRLRPHRVRQLQFLPSTIPTCCRASPRQEKPRIEAPSATLSRRAFLTLAAALPLKDSLPQPVFAKVRAQPTSAYDIVAAKDGAPLPLSDYSGKITLFVNVATYCVLTPQYSGLVSLHDTYQPQGFEIVASPCDQFGHQEPGSNAEICNFAKEEFGARFLLLDKLNVNEGQGEVAPLYQFLRNTSPDGTGAKVRWNFEKFLVGRDGKVLRRYKPGVLPEQISGDIEWALAHPGQELPPRKKPSLGVQ